MITSVGSLGAASDKNSSTDFITISPSRSVAVGAFVVAWVAWDSVYSVFNPNDGQYTTHITDDAGNIWTTIASETDDQGFFATGATVSIQVAQLRAALTTGSVITVNGGFAGTLIAKTVSLWEFALPANMRWAKDDDAWTTTRDINSQPSSIARNMHDTQEWLVLHVLGSEGPDTDSFTWDSDYTQITSVGTTGGADDTNITLRGGWRIATLSADTVAVTNNTASRDVVQAMVSVCAAKYAPGFPINPVLDDFNRANESPLANGTWNITRAAFGSANAQLVSSTATGGGGSFWDDVFEDCVEVYATFSDFVGFPSLIYMGGGNSQNATMTGNLAMWAYSIFGNPFSTIYFGLAGNQGSPPEQNMLVWSTGFDGVRWGVQRKRGPVTDSWVDHLWIDIGSGWEEVAAWYRVQGTSITSGNIGLSATSTDARLDDFGGGQIPCGNPFIPQIYRRQFGVA